MTKNLSERIAERVSTKKPSRNAQNRAAFLALRAEVKQAIDDGWPVKTIWETLHAEKKIIFSYQAFLNYVNTLITSQASVVADSKKDGKPDKKASKSIEKITETPADIGGFRFDPAPKKEDFL